MGGFLNAIMFWAFLGLLVPLFIHFWNKKQLKIQKVGSIKIYQTEESPKASSMLFSEPLLWLLRSIIISLMAFILMEPFIYSDRKIVENDETWIVLEPVLFPILKDKFDLGNVRLLTKGFPKYNSKLQVKESNENYWDLLYRFSESPKRPKEMQIYTQALPKNYLGEPPRLNFEIDWNIIPLVDIHSADIKAYKSNDTIRVLKAEFNQNITNVSFQYFPVSPLDTSNLWIINQDTLKIEEQQAISIQIVFNKSSRTESDYLLKALKVVEQNTSFRFRVLLDTLVRQSMEFDYIFFLTDKIPDQLKRNFVWRNSEAKSDFWFQKKLKNEILYQELQGTILLNAQTEEKLSKLPEALIKLFDQQVEFGVKPLSYSDLQTDFLNEDQEVESEVQYSITHWLWALLILVLTLERIFSFYRNQ